MHYIYLIKLFCKKIFNIFIIFFCLIYILNLFEEISFFQNTKLNISYPIMMTFLQTPSSLFIIFPFIFLIAVQLFFIELSEKRELDLLKINGFTNFKIIKVISALSFLLGILIVFILYNFSAKLQFIYLEFKNEYSTDDQYLAAVNKNGLWVKDIVEGDTMIINAIKIEKNWIYDLNINKFNEKFEIDQIILSNKADISDNYWKLYDVKILRENDTENYEEMIFFSNFNIEKINGIFKNLTSLNFKEVYELKKEYVDLGLATDEITIHLLKLISFPLYLFLMTILSSIIMLNIPKSVNKIFFLFIGILCSVIIFYINMIFEIFGENGSIPINLSIWIPLILLFSINCIGLVRINEK